MSNNKFHFEFKKRIPKINDFFFFHIQEINYSYCLFLKLIIFICLKNKLNIFSIMIKTQYFTINLR